MKDISLVVLAAGMGSRYGGLKQIDPMGPNGEFIIDYSIYDAVNAGFNKVVFVIKEENFKLFKEVIGNKISEFVRVEYVFQKLDSLPDGFVVPDGRTKPWGTAHAVLSCMDTVKEDFMVINADDFYGSDAYKIIYNFLDSHNESTTKINCCMAGFRIDKTVTENGYVSRGICSVDENKLLTGIVERTQIEYYQDNSSRKIGFTQDNGKSYSTLPPETIVSMNCWGFSSAIIGNIKSYFKNFLLTTVTENPLKSELFLPNIIGQLINDNICNVHVLDTSDDWFGVTYSADKDTAINSIAKYIANGKYPSKLWNPIAV